jgi:hypothetical protein
MHVPTTLLEAARARRDAGQGVEALQLLTELDHMPPGGEEPAPFARARAEALELQVELKQRLPRLRVDLSGAPQGDEPRLTLDGALRPECSSGCFVNPGVHVIAARTSRALAEEQLSFNEGDRQLLELVFSPLLGPSGSAADGASGAPPAEPLQVPTATWIAGGVALAGLTTGSVLGLHAVQRRDELRETCAPHCATDDVASVRRQVVVANVALGIGLSAAAVAVASYFLARPARASTPGAATGLQLGLEPARDARGGELRLGGRF